MRIRIPINRIDDPLSFGVLNVSCSYDPIDNEWNTQAFSGDLSAFLFLNVAHMNISLIARLTAAANAN